MLFYTSRGEVALAQCQTEEGEALPAAIVEIPFALPDSPITNFSKSFAWHRTDETRDHSKASPVGLVNLYPEVFCSSALGQVLTFAVSGMY